MWNCCYIKLYRNGRGKQKNYQPDEPFGVVVEAPFAAAPFGVEAPFGAEVDAPLAEVTAEPFGVEEQKLSSVQWWQHLFPVLDIEFE